jgi:lysophospholipase L1-like esterase
VLSKKPVLVLLEFSANECLGGYPAHDADTLLSALIQRIIADSVKVVLLSFIHPEMIDLARKIFWTQEEADLAYEYWYMLNSMAARYSLPFINYPLKGIYGNLNLMSYDMIHPNGAGYNKMATNVYQALIETFRTNGMLK